MLIANQKEGFQVARFKPFKGKDYVVVELKYNSGVSVSTAGFQSAAVTASRSNTLNALLEGFNIKSVRSHFGLSKKKLRERSVAAPTAMPGKVID